MNILQKVIESHFLAKRILRFNIVLYARKFCLATVSSGKSGNVVFNFVHSLSLYLIDFRMP